MRNLNLVLQKLAEAGLEFVVIGGYAGVLHGSSYVTNDLDWVWEITRACVGTLSRSRFLIGAVG
jgi:hypothetical protein